MCIEKASQMQHILGSYEEKKLHILILMFFSSAISEVFFFFYRFFSLFKLCFIHAVKVLREMYISMWAHTGLPQATKE